MRVVPVSSADRRIFPGHRATASLRIRSGRFRIRLRTSSGEAELDRASRRGGAGVDSQLIENVLDMGLRGTLADEELLTDFPVGSSIADKTEHFHLTRR